MRSFNRNHSEIRPINLTRNYIKHAEGSVLIEMGETKIICNASIEESVPKFLKGSAQGWVTAEYSMLPRATDKRNYRESMRGGPSGRTFEIQRLIARSLRSCVDLKQLGEISIIVDCDVIQADGGTRCAAITGGAVALYDAVQKLPGTAVNAFKRFVSAISIGVINDEILVDLDYQEDSSASTDMNWVLTDDQSIIEIQGTAEKTPFSKAQFDLMYEHAVSAATQLTQIQNKAVS